MEESKVYESVLIFRINCNNFIANVMHHYEDDADGLCCRLSHAVNSDSTLLTQQHAQSVGFDSTDSSVVARNHDTTTVASNSNHSPSSSVAATQQGKLFKEKGWSIAPSELKLGDTIGRGEFADVHVGWYQNQKVAVKVMKRNSNDIMDSFVSEASLMTSLLHKNLVRLLGVVIEEIKDIWMVTEFMPNGNLVDYVRSRGRQLVTKEQQISFACDSCEGMAYLESKNLVHRDLAARNILLAEDMSAKIPFILEQVEKNASFEAKSDTEGISRMRLIPKTTNKSSNGPSPFLGDLYTEYGIENFIVTDTKFVSDFGLAKHVDASSVVDDASGKFPIKWTAPEALRFSPIQDVVRHIEKGYRMEPLEGCPPEITAIMTDTWQFKPELRPSFRQLLVKLKTIEAGAIPD